jgi:hypothetical protein
VATTGEPVSIPLAGGHILVGGATGAGKSVVLQNLLVGICCDPTAELMVADAKDELAGLLAPVATMVAADLDDALGVLAHAAGVMASRRGQPGPHRPLVVVIDELAAFTSLDGIARAERVLRERFRGLLGDLAARGRSASVYVIAATQKPSVDVVPGGFRDNCVIRVALYCATRDASDTILGAGSAVAGIDAARLPADQPGSFIVRGIGPRPISGRAYHLDSFELAGFVAHGATLRRSHRRGPNRLALPAASR